MRCPNCESKQVKKRAVNLPKNVKRRYVGGQLDRFVCRACDWSGSEEDLVEIEEEEPEYDYDHPASW